jgi:hypothetical protein
MIDMICECGHTKLDHVEPVVIGVRAIGWIY